MKLLSTTPVSKGLVTKSTLVAAAVIMAVSSPMAMVQEAFADQYDDQINALRSQMNQYQSQANALNEQANTYQDALEQITEQKNAIISQIELSQKQYDQLQLQINDTKQKIIDNKEALGQIIADMYVDGSISPLEMLASSKNIGDYVDQQQYRSSVQNNLSDAIEEINALRKKLEKSQKEVEAVMEQQKSQRAQLAAKEAEQATLVEKTRGDEAAYKALASDAQAQMQSTAAQQRAYYEALQAQNARSGNNGGVAGGVVGSFQYTNWSGNQGCGGDGYPYCGVQDSFADPWGLYNRECVSYAAWRIEKVYGRKVNHFMGRGNAYEWVYSAKATRVYDPKPGDAVVLPIVSGFAPVGHLMVVESEPRADGWIRVSQYNFYGSGQYSTMDIKASGVVFLRF